MPADRDVHVHVERDDRYARERVVESDRAVEDEGAAAASFFTAQILWILLIVLLVVLIAAALGSGILDFGGASDPVDPTVAP
jgi:hypothetical protein